MTAHAQRPPTWPAASLPDAPDTQPMELQALGSHVHHCNGCRGRWFKLRCVFEAVDGFATARFVTTMFLLSTAFGLLALIL